MKTRIILIQLILFLSTIDRLNASLADIIITAVDNGTNGGLTLSNKPSGIPSQSRMPSAQPTLSPSQYPSNQPSPLPTSQPSPFPSSVPSSAPSSTPTSIPSDLPSLWPSSRPTSMPSTEPSSIPTQIPSSIPSTYPTLLPSNNPSNQPSQSPTDLPSISPTSTPSIKPTSFDETAYAKRFDHATRGEEKGNSEIDRNFIIMLGCSVAGLAVFTTLAAMFILRKNRNRHFEMIMSVKDDKSRIKEPEPLPATRSILRQLSNQLTVPMRTKAAEPAHNGMNSAAEFISSAESGELSSGSGGDISQFDPSTIQTEKTSVWGRRLERDASYDIESKPSTVSDFVLPSVFDPSTIRTEGSMARRTASSKAFERLEFFNDEPIPDQIFCIDEEE